MKITETIDRDCCNPQRDLKLYQGKKIGDLPVQKSWFCVHCGQLWRNYRSPGEMDSGLERITIIMTEP